MTRKQRRSIIIAGALAVLGVTVGLVLFALKDGIVFFYSPSEIVEKDIMQGQRLRVGGLVAEGSVERGDGARVRFSITDNAETIPVVFDGILPDLFREGQGVVAEGVLSDGKTFVADSVLAKHDENYMPPEVADSLKKQGVWQHDDTSAAKGYGQ
jgi:cytochrome c-type biogenesis protein CcmE